MTRARAFGYGMVLGWVILMAWCVAGCTAEDRTGHRMDFSLARADFGKTDSSSTVSVDGPGPREFTSSSSSSDGGDGWLYGVGYSIPMGEDQSEGELRLMNAHLAGMRSDMAELTAAIRGQQHLEESQLTPPESDPIPEAAPVVSQADPPADDDQRKVLIGAATTSAVALAAFFGRHAIMGFARARFPGMFS